MRLLSLTTNDEFKLTTFTDDESLPPYAILSHTWIEGQEVIYDELIAGTGKEKAGYDKLRFCGERAAQDGLQYFWVDTCCIDKRNNTELGAAINSMFRWYQRAARCYVFLLDVVMPHNVPDPQLYQITWEDAFRTSRWFTRGWTLQELIAPASVEFFSKERKRLGDRISLEHEIREITDLPIEVLRGQSLTEFSVDERMSWVARRKTTIKEDKVYCLFGIFRVFMPLIYGEGEEHAYKRLMEEIQKYLGQSSARRMEDAQELQAQNDVLKTLPIAADAPYNAYHRQHDPTCLPDTRVALLQDIYSWSDGVNSPCIFWLSGLAGTGKSTVARTVAAEYARQGRLFGSFFFSEGGGDVGHAGKFVTSLAVQLAYNIPSLRQAVYEAISERSDVTSQSLRDQWHHLVLGPLSKLAGSANSSSYILVIDALDECEGENDIRSILQIVADARSVETGRLRVFLTSRPEVPIRNGFIYIPSAQHQDFVLHNVSPVIVDHDIYVFLEHNFHILGKELYLSDGWPGADIINRLVCNASGLFIWAATAYRFVRKGRRFAVKRLNTLLQPHGRDLNTPEKHLDEIYVTVLRNCISTSYSDDEADELRCMLTSLLGNIVILLSPLPTISLSKLLSIPQNEIDQTLNELHAILDIPNELNRPLRLHHPSFRDFLLDSTRCGDTAFWVEEKQAHRTLAVQCMQLMSQHLKQDICGVKQPGALVVDIDPTIIAQHFPPEVQYACLYWVQHLERGDTSLRDDGEEYLFLQDHLLHWLEALSWMGKVSEGVLAISSLNLFVSSATSPDLSKWLYDTKRFVLYNRLAIEQAPLQTYSSALVFAPMTSIVRQQFNSCIPKWIRTLPKVENSWSAQLQTLGGHSLSVSAIAFSPDGKLLASADDENIKLWDIRTGKEIQTLKGYTHGVEAVAFFPNGKILVSSSHNTVRLWDISSGVVLQTLEGYSYEPKALAFSLNNRMLVSASSDRMVREWDTRSGVGLRTLKAHSDYAKAEHFLPNGRQLHSVRLLDDWSRATLYTLGGNSCLVTAVSFSPDGKTLATASEDALKLFDSWSGATLQVLKGHSRFKKTGSLSQQWMAYPQADAMSFSPNGETLATVAGCEIILWDVSSGAVLQTLSGKPSWIEAVAFSPDGKLLASASYDTVKLWDTGLGVMLQKLTGYSSEVQDIAFSPDGSILASAYKDSTVKLWDTRPRVVLQKTEGHLGEVTSVSFSPDGKMIVSVSHDAVKLWHVSTSEVLITLKGDDTHDADQPMVADVKFSPNGKMLALASFDGRIELWDISSGMVLRTLDGISTQAEQMLEEEGGVDGHLLSVNSVVFSPDGKTLASASGMTVKMWDPEPGVVRQTLEGHLSFVYTISFSLDGKTLASASDDGTVKLWDVGLGVELQTLKGHSNTVTSVAFSPDGRTLASASRDKTVKLWDAASGAVQRTLKGHSEPVSAVAFSPDGSYLETNRGILYLDDTQSHRVVNHVNSASRVSIERNWLASEDQNMLWLPPDARPGQSTVYEGSIAIGCPSGRVVYIGFSPLTEDNT